MCRKAFFCKSHFPDLVRILNGYAGKTTDESETSAVLFQEKDVMLALEEYWHIVEASPVCNDLNSRMISMIINPDVYAASDVRKYVPFHLHLNQCFLGQDNMVLDIICDSSERLEGISPRRNLCRHSG